jgi:hypothetical protein
MRERLPKQLSRREFLEVLELSALAFLPNGIQRIGEGVVGDFQTASCGHEGGYPGKDEGVAETGIEIIDNVGIESDGRKVNVVVDVIKVKENILSRADRMVSPAYYPRVERLIDKGLVISLGARPYSEVRMMMEDKDRVRGNNDNDVISKILIDLLGSVPSLFKLEGMYFLGEKPVIYINTGQVLANGGVVNLRRVWDHETAHLIYFASGKRESIAERMLETMAIQWLINALSISVLLSWKYKLMSEKRGVGLMDLLRERRADVKREIVLRSLFQLLPSLSASDMIHYLYFDDDEVLARRAVNNFPTQEKFFNRMIRIEYA